MKGHVDAETLAEYREGLLPRRAAKRVAAHLGGCPRCARLDAQLASVTATLAQAPAPPMPDALTARITAALAAEAAARDAQARQAGPHPALDPAREPTGRWASEEGRHQVQAPRGRAGRAERGRRHAREPRWHVPALRAAAATAVAVVVAGAGYGLLQILPSGTTSPSSSNGRGSSAHRYGGAQPGIGERTGAEAAPNRGLVPNVVHSGTNYQQGQLRAQVSTVLARSVPAATGSSSGATIGSAMSLGAFRNLPECVSRLTGGSAAKLVDIASYRGRPAAVIVAGIPSARELNVWVVATGCSGNTGDVLAHTMVATVP